MSGHSISAIVLFIGVAAIALASQHTDVSAGRAPASLVKKELSLGEAKPNLPRHTKKIHGPLQSKIELIGAIPEKAGDVFVLKGLVSASQDLRDVEFKWDIPAGLELVNGNLSGTISILSAGLPSEVQVTLRSLTGENYRVHFLAGGTDGGVRFAQSAQYNTLMQPLIEASKEAMLKSTEANTPPRKEKGLKVFH
jgi:hypothetical protein